MAAAESAPAFNPARPAPVFVPEIGEDDDVAIGVESAYPALQIERWAQDEAPASRPLY